MYILDILHPKTPSRVYLYNLSNKSKKLVKEQEIPSGHNPEDYIVERIEYKSHDGRLVPLTITRHKKTKIDGSANLLLYGYGSYGSSMSPNFSSTRLSLIDRDIIWATAHIRGGMEKGMKWWKEGKLTNKKNTFEDYIYAAKYLIDQKLFIKRKNNWYGWLCWRFINGCSCKSSTRIIFRNYYGSTICRFFNHKS